MKVKNYLKNVTNSIIYSASDIIKSDLMPNTGEFLEANKEFFTSTYAMAKSPKSFVKKQVQSFTQSKYYEAIDYGARNIFDDLKTGKFYNKERENTDSLKFAGSSMSYDNWNDLSEFGIDDDWEEQLNNNNASESEIVTAGDKQIVNSIESSNKAVANTTANAIAAAANSGNKNSRINTGILFNQNERLFSGLHSDISVLSATVDSIHKIVSQSLPNLDKNIASYFTEASKDRKELNAMVKELLNMQKNTAAILEAEDKKNRAKSGKARWDDININGLPNLGAYASFVKSNIAKSINGATGGVVDMMGEDSNMLAAMMANPLGGLMKLISKSLIPTGIKMATKELDKSLSGLFGTLMGRLSYAKNNSYDNPLLASLAKIFGVSTDIKKGIDSSKYQKGAVPFDGITRKAITDVIPSYLRRIEAAITGREETLYDYDKGSWKTVKSVQKEYDNIHKNYVRTGSSEIISKMSKALNIIKKGMSANDKKEFDKAIEEFSEYLYNHMSAPNPKVGPEQNGVYLGNYQYLYKYWNIIMLAYTNYDYDLTNNRHTDLSTRFNISNNILQARAGEERQYRDIELSGHSATAQIKASGFFANKHGKFVDDKFVANNSLLKIKDDLGNSIFNYLQKITVELKMLRAHNAGEVLAGSSNNSNNSLSKDLSDSDIKRLLMSKDAFESQVKKIKDQNNKQKASENEALNNIMSNDTIDFELNDKNPKLYEKAMAEKIAKAATKDFNSSKSAQDNENFITRAINKYDGKSLKDLDNAYSESAKDGKEVKKQEKEKSQTQILIDRAKLARAKFNAVIGSGSDVFTNLLYTADRAIYDMMFKAEIKNEDGDSKPYKGFIDLISSKANEALDKIGEKTRSIFDPLLKALGIDDKGKLGEFKKRTANAFKNIGGKLVKEFIDANKDVYSPLYERLMGAVGVETKAQKIKKRVSATKDNIRFAASEREHFKNNPQDLRLRKSAMKAVATGNYNIMENHKDLLGTVDERRDFLLRNHLIDGMKMKYYDDDAINKAYFRFIESTHAAGTTPSGKPFKGLSTLHKGEAVFNSKISGVIDKTGLYNITEPTHILNRYDTNNLLGIKNNKSKSSTIKSDLYDEKKIKKQIFSHPDGTVDTDKSNNKTNGSDTIGKAVDAAKKKYKNLSSEIDFDEVKRNAKLYAPEGIAGGVIGGLATTLLGIVGGPIIGALLGSTAGVVSSSNSLKDKLFGAKDESGKRNGGKLFGDKIMGAINKYAPDITKYGLAGIIPGLITPFGPIGGMLIGGGIGYLKNNESFMSKYFGAKDAFGKRSGGKLTLDNQTKGLIQKMVPGAAKGAAAGAIASLVIGGPFGLLGSAAIGSALGMMTTTDAFKEGILGKKGEGGLLNEVKIAFHPLKDAAKKVANDMVETFDKYVVDPLSRFISPFVNQVQLALEFIPRKLGGIFEEKIGKPIGSFINKHLITPFNKLLGGVFKKLSGGIKKLAKFNPFNLLGVAGDAMKRHQIKIGKGVSNSMTGKERLDFMTKALKKLDNETDEQFNARLASSYKGYKRDASLAAIGTKGGMSVDKAKKLSNELKAVSETTKQIAAARKEKSREILTIIRKWRRDGSDARISDKAQTAIEKALSNDHLDNVEQILHEWDLVDTKTGESRVMTDDEISDIMNGRNGKSGLKAHLSQFKDITRRKKIIGKLGGKGSKSRESMTKALIKKMREAGFKDVKSGEDFAKYAKLLDTEIADREAHSRDKVIKKATGVDQEVELKNAANIDKSASSLSNIEDFLKEEIMPGIKKLSDIFDKNNQIDSNKLDNNMDLARTKETSLNNAAKNLIYNASDIKNNKIKAPLQRGIHNLEDAIHDKTPGAKNKIKNAKSIARNEINKLRHIAKINKILKNEAVQEETINQDAVPEHGIGTMLLGGLVKGAKAAGGAIMNLGKKAANSFREIKAQRDIDKLSKSNNPMATDEGNTKVTNNTVINPANGDAIKMKTDSDGSVEPDTSDSKTKSVLNKISIKEKFKEKLEQAQLKAAEISSKAFGEQQEGGKKMKWWQLLIYGLVAAPFIKKVFTGFIKPLWKDYIKPWASDVWNNNVKPFFTDTVFPWVTDTVLPLVEEGFGKVIGYLIQHLPEIIYNGIRGMGTVLDYAAGGNKYNAGTSTKTDGSKLSEKYGANIESGMTDEKGNKLTYDQIANGDYEKIYNDRGVEGIVNEDGTVTFKDQSVRGASYASTVGNAMKHGFAKSLATNKVSLLTKASNKVAKSLAKHVGLMGSVGKGAYAITAPINVAENAGVKARKGLNKYVDNVASNMLEKAAKKGASPQELQELATKVAKGDGSKASKVVGKIADYTDNGIVGRARDLVSSAKDKVKNFIPGSAKEAAESGAEKAAGNAAKAVAKETGEEATKSTLKSVTKKAAKESGKSGGFLKKILVKAKDAIEKLLENSTVKKKLIAVAESLGQTATAQWLKGIKESIQKVFDEAIEKGIKKVGADTCKKVLSKALAIVFLVTDFITGADQAESILGVNETSLVEEFIAGLINALCNFLIIPSIVPGTSWIAQHLFKIFGKDLTERQKEADKDYEEYKEKNGSTLSKEEYLKRKHSVTGKIGGAISDTFGKIGSGIKKGAGKIADKAKEAVSNVKNLAGKAKKKLIGDTDSVTDEELAQYNAEHGTTYTKEQYAYYVKSFVGKTASKINTAIRNPKETLSNLKDKAWDLLGNAKDSISSTIKEINKIKEKSDSVITKAEDGKISPFSKQYWNIKSSNKGIAGALESVYGIFQRITKLPFVMISNVFNSVKSWFGKIRDKLVKKFGGIVDFIKDPIGSVKSLLGKGKGNSSSSDSDNTKKSNSVVDKLKSVGSGIKSFFGMGYDKQIDPSIANIRFNAPGDTQYQTIGDSGCGPAAAVSAIKSAYGRGSNDIVSASKYAVSNGYKEKNGGTKPQFFKDYFNKQGLTSSTTSNKSALMNNIKAGRPTVLMGTDSKGVNPNNPFGTNPHYVTVTGMDGRGNAIVQDPESKKDNQLYKINNLLSKSSFGVSVTGRNKSRFGRSKYGKGLRGSCTNEQAYNFFIDNGFTAAAAAGAVGNLMAEAGTDSSGQIDASSIESNGEGVGIVQWSYGRKQEFLQYCKDNGNPFPNKDLSLQLGFIIKELNGGEWRKYNGYGHPEYLISYNDFMKCTDVEIATGAWMSCYERPNAKYAHLDRRISYAKDIYNKYSGNTPIEGGSSIGGDSSSSTDASNSFEGLISILGKTKAGKALSAFTGLLDGSSSDDSSSSSNGSSASSDSTSAGTASGATEKATAQMEAWANDDSHGYSQSNDRYGNPDFDCSGAVIQAWQNAGIDVKGAGATNTRDIRNAFLKMGFEDVTSQINLNTGEGLQRGDVLLAEASHTGMWTGSGIVHASSSRGNPQAGDQNGKEFYVTDGYYKHSGGWDYVLRYKTATSVDKKDMLMEKRLDGKGKGGTSPLTVANSMINGFVNTTSKYGKGLAKGALISEDLGSREDSKYKALDAFKSYTNALTGKNKRKIPKKAVKIASNKYGKGLNTSVFSDLNNSLSTSTNVSAPSITTAQNNNSNINYTALLNVIIQTLAAIADNTDKLNSIVTLLNERLGTNITSSDVSKQSMNNQSIKSKIKNALLAQQSANEYGNYVNNTNNSSMNVIINAMNAIASE